MRTLTPDLHWLLSRARSTCPSPSELEYSNRSTMVWVEPYKDRARDRAGRHQGPSSQSVVPRYGRPRKLTVSEDTLKMSPAALLKWQEN